ncbi:hypothetical protein SFR_7049 (plasmid) [Streptomyces sp. FR-008]|nr:hypothetical protein SFR_7049 [Streptomyces sp. FR-008]
MAAPEVPPGRISERLPGSGTGDRSRSRPTSTTGCGTCAGAASSMRKS